MLAKETLCIELELARAGSADDPYAFRFGRQTYSLRSNGGSYTQAELSWDDELLSALGRLRQPGRDAAIQQEFGERLRKFLSSTHWQIHEAAIIAAGLRGQQVILTIRSSAAELYALPWELITLTASGQHIGELSNVLVRYEWPATVTKPRLATSGAPRRRVLMAWSAAAGAVPAAAHIRSIRLACTSGQVPFDENADVISHVSLTRLRAALESAQEACSPITILHLLCHGASAGKSFGLVLNSDDSFENHVVVDGGRLRQVLAPFADQLRLVVLMACDSSNSGELGNQLGSIAQSLHRVGFAAVVASRYPLSVGGSEQFTQVFYDAVLGRRLSLDRAIPLARRRLAEDASQADWASLQFYSRAADQPESASSSILPRTPLLARYGAPIIGGAALLAALLVTGKLMPVANRNTAADAKPQSSAEASGQAPPLKDESVLVETAAAAESPADVSAKKSPQRQAVELSQNFVVEALAHCKQEGTFDTKIDINKGDHIAFIASGKACINDPIEGTGCTGPDGNVTGFEGYKYGALVGRIGEPGTGRLFTIGSKLEYDADLLGRLYMFYWDKNCSQNSGSYNVAVRIKRAARTISSDQEARSSARSKNCLSAKAFARIPVKAGQQVHLRAYVSPLCSSKGWSSGGPAPEFGGPRGIGGNDPLALSPVYPVGALMFAYSTKSTNDTLDVWDILRNTPLMYYNNGYDGGSAPVDGYLYMMFNELRDSMGNNLGSIMIEAHINGKRINIE